MKENLSKNITDTNINEAPSISNNKNKFEETIKFCSISSV